MATLGFYSSNEESCPINLVDNASITLALPSGTSYSTSGLACSVASNTLTCTLTPSSFTFNDYLSDTNVILNKVFELTVEAQLPNPGSTDTPLSVSRTISLEISKCDVTTCATCDENAVDVNVSPANPFPTAWKSMIGEYHSKMTSDERQVLLDLASGCTYCL